MHNKSSNIVMLGPSTEEKGGMGTVAQLILSQTSPTVNIKHASTWDGETKTIILFSKALAVFLQKLITGKVDLVHIHIAERGSTVRKSILAILAFIFTKPVIMHAHGAEFHLFHAKLPKLLKKLLNKVLQSCTYLIVLSESWKSFYVRKCGVKPEKVLVLPNPVVMPKQAPRRINSEKISCLFLGKINQRKGIYDLLNAMARLEPEAQQQIKLVLAGSGEIEQTLSLAKALNLDSMIEFPGWINSQQKEQLMADADIFLLPSYNEGLPMALLEAMSWGLPVITTPVGGIPEIVTHAQTGLLTEPGDVTNLAKLMQTLIYDESLRLSLGKAARKQVSSLDIDNYYNRLLDVYDSALKSKKNRDVILPI